MTSDDPMKTALLDFLHELDALPRPVIVGGGYGLYLKQTDLGFSSATRTLLPVAAWPNPRSTEDFDVFLPTEILTATHMQTIRAGLDRLKYTAVEHAKFLRFEKTIGEFGRAKLDFLTGPIIDPDMRKTLKLTNLPRVRPKEKVELHAYLTPEALEFDNLPFCVEITGARSTGETARESVYVPQTFTFLLMKLHAFSDRQARGIDAGRRHALDVYRVAALMTEPEYEQAKLMLSKYRGHPELAKARRIVSEEFKDQNSIGLLRLREHPLFHDRMEIEKFLSILHEFFP